LEIGIYVIVGKEASDDLVLGFIGNLSLILCGLNLGKYVGGMKSGVIGGCIGP